MILQITKTLGLLIICLLALGLAVEATIKLSIGLLTVAFWGIILIGLWAIYEKLFHP